MIALDTSSVVAYLDGSTGKDVLAVDLALEHQQTVLPPVVLCELLSAPRLASGTRTLFEQLPLLAARGENPR